MTKVAWPKIEIFPAICGCEIFQQLDLVTARGLQDRKFQLSAFDSRDLLWPFACLMRAVRKFEAQNIPPKRKRAVQI